MTRQKPRVVFDTNACRDERSQVNFFGFRNELQKFSEIAEIVFPKIVIDEIISQKKRYLGEQRENILKNSLVDLVGVDRQSIERFNIQNHLDQLFLSEKIPFKAIELSDTRAAFSKIYNWSIENQPPFEEKSDKGFKDAYVACVIDELIASHDDELVFLCTKDLRLSQLYISNPRVRVVKDFEDFRNYSLKAFIDEYLHNKICEELGKSPQCQLAEGWLNIDDNWVIKVVDGELVTYVVVDSGVREILGHSNIEPEQLITNLASSNNFQATHSAISDLEDIIKYLTMVNMRDIINVSITNSQIYWIGEDEDVKGFLLPIFEFIKESLDEEMKKTFMGYYGVRP